MVVTHVRIELRKLLKVLMYALLNINDEIDIISDNTNTGINELTENIGEIIDIKILASVLKPLHPSFCCLLMQNALAKTSTCILLSSVI